MTDVESVDTPVPAQVEHGGLVWNLIKRGDGTWGIQQGLSHQGELVRDRDADPATVWRVVTKTIPYSAPGAGFTTWFDAIDHFLTIAGPDAIDGHAMAEGD